MAEPNTPDGDWERALKLVMPSDFTVTTRLDVTGEKSPSWVTDGHVVAVHSNPVPFDFGRYITINDTRLDIWKYSAEVTVWQQQQETGLGGTTSTVLKKNEYYVVVGINFPLGEFYEVKDSIYLRFMRQFAEGVNSLYYSPYENDVASRRSFWSAFETIRSVGNWAALWQQNFLQWANGINGESSDWQGSAAGQFGAALRSFADQLDGLYDAIHPRNGKGPVEALTESVLALEHGLRQLNNADTAFRNSMEASDPRRSIYRAWEEVTGGIEHDLAVDKKGHVTVKDPSKDPRIDGVRYEISKRAKEKWVKHVEEILDVAAREMMNGLAKVYRASAEVLTYADINSKPVLVPPKAPPKSGSGGGGDSDGDGESDIDELRRKYEEEIKKIQEDYRKKFDDLDKEYEENVKTIIDEAGDQGDDARKEMDELNSRYKDEVDSLQNEYDAELERLRKEFDDQTQNLDNPVVNPITGLPDPPEQKPVLLPAVTQDGLGGFGDGLGPLGRQVLDADGNPITVPEGFTVTPDGRVVDALGNPLLDGQGRPVTVPPGFTLPPDTVLPLSNSMVIGPDGKPVLGPDNALLQVPKGSVVRPDGTVIGPDGKPVLDGNGDPIKVPPGSTVVPGSTVIGPDGDLVLDGDGDPITVPVGSTIGPDGAVIGPDGKPVLDADGDPIRVPQGSTISSVPNPVIPPVQIDLPDLPGREQIPLPAVPPVGIGGIGANGTPGADGLGGGTATAHGVGAAAGGIGALAPSAPLVSGGGLAGGPLTTNQPSQMPFAPPMGGGSPQSEQPKPPRGGYPVKENIAPRRKARAGDDGGSRSGGSDRQTPRPATTSDADPYLNALRRRAQDRAGRSGAAAAAANTPSADDPHLRAPLRGGKDPRKARGRAGSGYGEADDDVWGTDPDVQPGVIGR